MQNQRPSNSRTTIRDALSSLPLFDDIYLKMQATNLDVVDDFLEQQEHQLLEELFEQERTPIPITVFVTALSQMWGFAVYELMRTWRQRVRDSLPSHERSV